MVCGGGGELMRGSASLTWEPMSEGEGRPTPQLRGMPTSQPLQPHSQQSKPAVTTHLSLTPAMPPAPPPARPAHASCTAHLPRVRIVPVHSVQLAAPSRLGHGAQHAACVRHPRVRKLPYVGPQQLLAAGGRAGRWVVGELRQQAVGWSGCAGTEEQLAKLGCRTVGPAALRHLYRGRGQCRKVAERPTTFQRAPVPAAAKGHTLQVPPRHGKWLTVCTCGWGRRACARCRRRRALRCRGRGTPPAPHTQGPPWGPCPQQRGRQADRRAGKHASRYWWQRYCCQHHLGQRPASYSRLLHPICGR